MKCTNCSYKNKSDAYFCVKCGNQLRTKYNGWKYLFFISLPILLLFLFMYAYSFNRINELSHELSNKEYENRQLKSEKPKIYKTNKNNVTIYYRNGDDEWKDSGFQYTTKGTQITIYVIDSGYGLMEYGWIPMSHLNEIYQ